MLFIYRLWVVRDYSYGQLFLRLYSYSTYNSWVHVFGACFLSVRHQAGSKHSTNKYDDQPKSHVYESRLTPGKGNLIFSYSVLHVTLHSHACAQRKALNLLYICFNFYCWLTKSLVNTSLSKWWGMARVAVTLWPGDWSHADYWRLNGFLVESQTAPGWCIE